MVPPWKEFPDYEPHCLGWRMNGGEDYLEAWRRFMRALSQEERAAYVANEPAHEGWQDYYDAL
jgi:hypothetical protein